MYLNLSDLRWCLLTFEQNQRIIMISGAIFISIRWFLVTFEQEPMNRIFVRWFLLTFEQKPMNC